MSMRRSVRGAAGDVRRGLLVLAEGVLTMGRIERLYK
jgi:hypothetical protein